MTIRSRAKPTYSLDDAKRMAKEGKLRIYGRAEDFIIANEGEQAYRLVADLIQSIEPEDFHKSDELNIRPGTFADIYRHVPYVSILSGELNEWYVKFFIDEGMVKVHVLSANYEGAIH